MFFSWSAAFFTLGIIQYATEIGGLLLTSSDPASILVAIQIRNKAHILPYFFSYLSNQNYPKDRIALHIRSDHNEDRSVEITQKWIDKHKEEYADISFKYRRFPTTYENEESPQSWPNERTKTLMMLREEALISGLKKGFDYLLMLDADVLLSNSSFLQGLLEAQKPIIAPLIFSYNGYLNFEIQASQIQEDLMTMAQEALAKGDVRGIFPVTQVKHCILIDLKNPKAGRLTFDSTRLIGDYSQYGEDIFSASAWENGIDMFLDNRILTSIMPPPLRSDEQLDDDQQRTLAAVSYASGTEWHYVYEDDIFKEDQIMEDQSNLGLEKVFVINLARRPEKKARLAKLLPTLGWEPTFVSAIDGKNLDLENLVRKGIVPMDDYIDRYNHRKMTMGEIGCVLSHYLIWKEIVDNGYEMALILEDDVSFEPYSKRVIRKSLGELKENNISWDLLYVGRQPRRKDNRPDFEETWVTPYVVKSGYSYWLLAYILTLEGAKKLVNTSILEQLIPSDEYVPVMSDVHPDLSLSERFPVRNLRSYAIESHVASPRYFSDDTTNSYVTDTENSVVMNMSLPINTATQEEKPKTGVEIDDGLVDFDSQYKDLLESLPFANAGSILEEEKDEVVTEVIRRIKLLLDDDEAFVESVGHDSSKTRHEEL